MQTIALGPFAVTPDGLLMPRPPHAAPRLCFAWRGRDCLAELGPDGLTMAADAARIPSTADPGGDRRRAFDAVAGLPARLPPGWRVRLMADHRVRIQATTTFRSPPDAILLVATIVRFVLALDAHLDALEAAGACWRMGATAH